MNARKILFRILAIVILGYVAITILVWPTDDILRLNYDRADPSVINFSYGNGLGDEQRKKFYHLSQGSEILPIRLLRAIEDPKTEKPFMENMERFGLLPDPDRTDGLAVGMTTAANKYSAGIEMVGITCAACHVGEFRHNGKGVRVDGAPNMFDMQMFYADMFASANYSFTHVGPAYRTLQRLVAQSYRDLGILTPLWRPVEIVADVIALAYNYDQILARFRLAKVIKTAIERRDAVKNCSEPKVKCTSGFGRLDAFNGTRNFMLARLSQDNLVELDAPVKFPPVWGFEHFSWFEWTRNTNSVMERNLTETLGAGATVQLEVGSRDRFSSSIPIRQIHELEQLAYYLKPPLWPEEVLGKIDMDLTRKGEPIYRANCAGCHDYGPTDYDEKGLLKLRMFSPLPDASPDIRIDTDPTAALRVACPVPNPGDLELPKRTYSKADAGLLKDCKVMQLNEENGVSAPFEAYAFSAVVNAAAAQVKDKAYAAANVSDAERVEFEDLDRRGVIRWRDTLIDDGRAYAARPLEGIWAAAPYLHNGSVPTLLDLLSPAADRMKKFPIGHREYDPVKVGFRTDLPESEWKNSIDTEADEGSDNSGHLFGTDLPSDDKLALIEYLKLSEDQKRSIASQ